MAVAYNTTQHVRHFTLDYVKVSAAPHHAMVRDGAT
jgi:hypothetical protein